MQAENNFSGEIGIFLENFAEKITTAIETVKNEGVSNYPIIVIFPESKVYEIGILLTTNSQFQCNISTLEELYVKNIVESEKVNNFKTLYNHKSDCICVLIISDLKADFLFIPIPLS